MNSKEALDYIRNTDEWKDYYSIDLELDIIEEDLKILEILKKYIKISDCKFEKDSRYGQCILMFIPDFVDDYRDIKEWLENDK